MVVKDSPGGKWPSISENVHVHPTKIKISLRIRAVWSESPQGVFWIAKFVHADNEDSKVNPRYTDTRSTTKLLIMTIWLSRNLRLRGDS